MHKKTTVEVTPTSFYEVSKMSDIFSMFCKTSNGVVHIF